MVGFLFAYSFDQVSTKSRPSFKKLPFVLILIFIMLLIIANSLVTRERLLGRVKSFDKYRHEALWQMVKPYFANLEEREKDRVIYYEGDLSQRDHIFIGELFKYRLALWLGFTRPRKDINDLNGKINTVVFVNDKEKVKKLFRMDATAYQELSLIQPITEDNFIALKFNSDNVKDITKEFIMEVK